MTWIWWNIEDMLNSPVMKNSPIIIFIFIVVGFIVMIALEDVFAKDRVLVTYELEVHPVIVDRIQSGGGIVFNDNKYVVSSISELIISSSTPDYKEFMRECTAIWRAYPRVTYRLSDVMVPFTLSKRANCDTLVVEKDGHILKFLLHKEDNTRDFGWDIVLYIIATLVFLFLCVVLVVFLAKRKP